MLLESRAASRIKKLWVAVMNTEPSLYLLKSVFCCYKIVDCMHGKNTEEMSSVYHDRSDNFLLKFDFYVTGSTASAQPRWSSRFPLCTHLYSESLASQSAIRLQRSLNLNMSELQELENCTKVSFLRDITWV